nr:histamine H1 receptor-like [Hydra vulgaris]
MTNQSDVICRQHYVGVGSGIKGVFLSMIYAAFSVFIIVSNLLLLKLLSNTRKKKYSTNNEKLVLLLSFVDLVVGSVVIPLQLVLFIKLKAVSCLFISITAFWLVFLLVFSGSIVVLISIERFVTVLHNKRFYGIHFNGACIITIIIFQFLISFGLGIWYALLVPSPKSLRQQSIYFFSISTYIFLNIILIFIINTLLLIKTKKMMRIKEIHVAEHNVVERRLNKTMMLISTSLMILYLPSVFVGYTHAVNLYLNVLKQSGYIWTIVLCEFNSAFNPSIYISRNKKYLKLYKFNIRLLIRKFLNKKNSKVYQS